MTKVVAPFPPPVWGIQRIPQNACWWRHAMIHKGPDGFLFTWTRYGDIDNDSPANRAWDGISAVSLEWYDGLDTIIDAGMDTPTVYGMCQIYVEPIDYIDLLSDKRPAASFYRITKYGDKNHPGMHTMPDLDLPEGAYRGRTR